MSHKSPARRALSQFRRLLRVVGLMEAAPPSVRNARQRVRARRPLAGEDPHRLVIA
jgi:hypothetical protein